MHVYPKSNRNKLKWKKISIRSCIFSCKGVQSSHLFTFHFQIKNSCFINFSSKDITSCFKGPCQIFSRGFKDSEEVSPWQLPLMTDGVLGKGRNAESELTISLQLVNNSLSKAETTKVANCLFHLNRARNQDNLTENESVESTSEQQQVRMILGGT